MTILLDVTRTLLHVFNATVTGIDRVEHAYVKYFLDRPLDQEVWFIVTTPFVKGALSRSQMRREMDRLRGTVEVDAQSLAYQDLTSELSRPINLDRDRALRLTVGYSGRANKWKAYSNIAHLAIKTHSQFTKLIRRSDPCLYLHTSHTDLEKGKQYEWLHAKNIKSVFFLHDIIPIQYPEFCPQRAEQRHRERLRTIASKGNLIVANSHYTAASIREYLLNRSPIPIPVVVSPLANTFSVATREMRSKLTDCHPYFIHIGTLEGRKNIGHLLNVWRNVISHFGARDAPRLILVGKRGWECETVFDILERSRELASHVVELSGITDKELMNLLRSSRGLITVSFVEGFGLPPVEAVREGIPVIASDIPAHREVLLDNAEFVDATDGPGLVDAVARIMNQELCASRSMRRGVDALCWDDHVKKTMELVRDHFPGLVT